MEAKNKAVSERELKLLYDERDKAQAELVEIVRQINDVLAKCEAKLDNIKKLITKKAQGSRAAWLNTFCTNFFFFCFIFSLSI